MALGTRRELYGGDATHYTTRAQSSHHLAAPVALALALSISISVAFVLAVAIPLACAPQSQSESPWTIVLALALSLVLATASEQPSPLALPFSLIESYSYTRGGERKRSTCSQTARSGRMETARQSE